MSYHEPTMQECLEAYGIEGIHPAAELFPLMTGDDFQELCEDIGVRGLQDDVELTHDGLLLDGRNRLRALLVTGQCERFKWLDELYANDYVGYVISRNLKRRHLLAGQRAAIAVEAEKLYAEEAKQRQLSTLKQYRNDESSVPEKIPERGPSAHDREARTRAARDVGVNPRYVSDAKKIQEEDSGLFDKVKAGETNIPKAKQEIARRKAEPRQYITLAQWKEERLSVIPEASNQAEFNRQTDNSEDSMGNIEWAKWSWNPVTGCKHDCPYCYARDIAERFYPQGFEPTIHPDRLTAPYNTKVPREAETDIAKRNVFANSMSDLYGRWVPQEWIDAVFKAMADNPQWNFLTLTKFPKRAAKLDYPDNVWIGTSVDRQNRVKAAEEAFEQIDCGVRWLSLEPLLEPLTFTKPELFDWVVIGGASRSNKTPEWTPPAEWVANVMKQFVDCGSKIYIKTNARSREYPGVDVPEIAPDEFS